MSNPFMDLYDPTPAPPAPVAKGFTGQIITKPCGDPNCKSNTHRKDGSHYSTDPSIRMAELQADGKMGAQFGKLGGPKAKSRRRAAEVIAEAAAEEAEKLKQVFLDGIDESNPIGIRLATAEKFLKVEQGEIERDLKTKQAEFEAMSREQVLDSVNDMLERLSKAGVIATEVLELTEGDVVEEDA